MRLIDIEAFLSWAYREELPKALREDAGGGPAASSMWDAIGGWADSLGALVSDGRPNSYGVMPSHFIVSPPHPDALAAHAAVAALDAWDLALPDDWDPLGDLGLSEADRRDAVARAMHRIVIGDGRRPRQRPAELIRHHAIMRNAPGWEAEKPKSRPVMLRGKPAWFRKVPIKDVFGHTHLQEVEGYNPRAKRPYPDAYRKSVLDPDPMFAAIDRAEYEVWHAALGALTEALNDSGRLGDHVVGPTKRPAQPWLERG